MTDEMNTGLDPNELMKRMKAIASDLWGGVSPAEEGNTTETPEPENAAGQEPEKKEPDIGSLWKTADETIDWTDALAHSAPTDGLTAQRLWSYYHKQARKVLSGDLNTYTEVLKKANPLEEMTAYAEDITMRVISADRLESRFTCSREWMEKDHDLYLAAMGLRIARDLLACLPVEEVAVTAEDGGKEVFHAVYSRMNLLHRNFTFTDPVALARECGAEFTDSPSPAREPE